MPTYEWERVFGREFASLGGASQEAFLAAVAQFVVSGWVLVGLGFAVYGCSRVR